jgi:hypothetical protein
LKDALELAKWLRENKNDFANKELMSILYILYFSLHALSDRFTHYDLHSGNVLLYRPSETGYINYVFHEHNPSRVVRFKSRFIPKIIDYGRSFYKLDAHNNSDELYNKLCTLDECKPWCGFAQGFSWLNSGTHHIRSREKNVSHDLRLLDYLKVDIIRPYFKASSAIKKLFNKVVYSGDYGTPEIIGSGLPNKINNIYDAFSELSDMVYKEEPKKSDDLYSDPEHISYGELHVYSDGQPMRFIKHF